MSEWKEYKLNDLVTKLGDGLHGTPKYDPNGENYFINGSNLINGKISVNENTKRVTNEEFNKYKKELTDRTILVSINGTLGNIATYNNEKVILGKSACYFNVKEDVCKEFIKYIVTENSFQHYISEYATGSTIKNVPLKAIRDYTFKLPDLPTQTAIAEILSSLDDKIELNNKINQELETLAQTLFKQWFIDFEFPNENGDPYKSSGGEMVDSELGEIPNGWIVSKVKDWGEVVCGKTPPKSNKEYFGEDVLFIKIPDMHNKVFITKSVDGLSLLGANSQKNKLLKKGSVILSSIATVGLVSIVSKDSQTNQQINAIIPNESFFTYFLFLILKTKSVDFKQLASGGSATLNMNTSTFKEYKLLKPIENILIQYDNLISSLFEKIYILTTENEELIATRDLLLPKLISGELEINEISN
ncbi:restriction endonuclease subunit S [Aquirufa nivalisilvae]